MLRSVENQNWQWNAPEVIQAKQYDEQSDLYSYAMVLYEIYSGGQLPFAEYAGTARAINMKTDIETGKLRPTIPLGTPEWIVSVMREMWVQEPSERLSFHSASQRIAAGMGIAWESLDLLSGG